MKYLIIGGFLLFFGQIKAQILNHDSLLTIWQSPKTSDTSKMRACNELIQYGFFESNSRISTNDSAKIEYALNLFNYANKVKNSYYRAASLMHLGVLNENIINFKENSYFKKALELIDSFNYHDLKSTYLRLQGSYQINIENNVSAGINSLTDALEHAKKGKFQLQIGKCYKFLVKASFLTLNFNQAEKYVENAEPFLQNKRAIIDYIELLDLKAMLLLVKGENYKALDTRLKLLGIAEKKPYLLDFSMVYQNLIHLYNNFGYDSKVLEVTRKYHKYKLSLGDKNSLVHRHLNISTCFLNLGMNKKADSLLQLAYLVADSLGDTSLIYEVKDRYAYFKRKSKNYEEAINIYLDVLDYYGKRDSTVSNNQKVLAILNNIGKCYYLNGQLENAEYYLKRALMLVDKSQIKLNSFASLLCLGKVFITKGEYGNAIKKCSQALKVARKSNFIAEIEKSCNCLYIGFDKLNKKDSALLYFKEKTAYKDSLFNEETTKKLTSLELQFQFDKEKEIELAEQKKRDAIIDHERKNEKLIRNSLLLIVFLVIVSLFIIIRQFKITNKEKKHSDELLLNILPAAIADELKQKGESQAKEFNNVSIMFTDFKSFTQTAEKLSAKELVDEINTCFKAFDHICEKYGIEKIKTIGDSYMAAAGLGSSSQDKTQSLKYASNLVSAALEMQHFMTTLNYKPETLNFEMRAGIHTGHVVAGIVGVKKFQYDIWGDTVNTASRMESHGEVGKVNISEATYELIKNDNSFSFESRGKIDAKGKGEMEMYFVTVKNDRS